MVALHVHHGLSPHADGWLAHCEAVCREAEQRGHAVRFSSRVLSGRPARGDSVEAWARQARYRALRDMALDAGADLVLLAHHRRDQAETFLLQALRGGGAAALAAMPREVRREGITWARPWLDRPREAIEAYARVRRLAHVDDESNDDLRFARNRLRSAVWPALVGAFPDAEARLADAAHRIQDAAALLEDIAQGDLARVDDDGSLDIAAWQALSAQRRSNVLRAWLRLRAGLGVPASVAVRLDGELRATGSRRWPIEGGELRSYRGRLRLATTTSSGVEPTACGSMRRDIPEWNGALVADPVLDGGLAADAFARLTVRARRPTDRFQAGPARPPRSLKLQFQAVGVPEWERNGPVACDGDRLVFVPGLGLDARVLAPAGVPQFALRWTRC